VKLLLILIMAFLAGYLAYAGWFLINQRRVVFPRHRIPYDEVLTDPPGDAEVFWFEAAPGEQVEAWLLPHSGPEQERPAALAIVAHGNGEVIDRWVWKVQGLRDQGVAVLLVEYPGYGRSTGKPTQQKVIRVLTQAYDTVTEMPEIDARRILLIGRSLGSGAVCALSMERPSCAMLLISPFTSIGDHARKRWLPPAFVNDPFDNLTAIGRYEHPVMILHGTEDRLNPPDHALRLHAAARMGTLRMLDGVAHHDCPPDWVGLWTECEPFFRDAGLMSSDGDRSQSMEEIAG